MVKKEELPLLFKKYRPDKIKNIIRAKEGVSSIVHKIVTHNNDVYFFKQGDNNYKIQYLLNNKLNKLGINTPPIVGFSDNWLLIKGVNGKKLDIQNREAAAQVLTELGKQISLLHQYKTSGFGPLISSTEGRYGSYLEYRKKMSSLIPKRYYSLVYGYVNKVKTVNLNHGDLFPSHIYVDSEGKFVSLIDWDDVLSAPRKCDLSEFLLSVNNDTKIWEAFMKGYVKHSDYIEPDDKYLLVEELLQVVSSYYWLSKEHPENTKALGNKQRKVKNVLTMLEKYI